MNVKHAKNRTTTIVGLRFFIQILTFNRYFTKLHIYIS